jgi:archaeal type IV pilus assembly protein PilA
MSKISGSSTEQAVSPVVGVMLMLIVVVIIAAVVSGFAGGLLGNQEKSPTLSMDMKIKNSGYWVGSYLSARVTGVEKAIPTSDLKIVTKWSATAGNGTRFTGGNTVSPTKLNGHVYLSPSQGCTNRAYFFFTAPTGYGTGVGEGTGVSGSKERLTDSSNWFGNYSLKVGTTMWAQPYGETARPTGGGYTSTSYAAGYGIGGTKTSQYNYTVGVDQGTSSCYEYVLPTVNSLPIGTELTDNSAGTFDSMTAVLGQNWNLLRSGDIVTVSVIHTPSGRTIWKQDIVVEG